MGHRKTFTAVKEGYGAQNTAAYNITVSNTGNQPTGVLQIELSGANSNSFTLSKQSISNIAVGESDNFTVLPKSGLTAGTYDATVMVGGNITQGKSFNVAFIVQSSEITPTKNTQQIPKNISETFQKAFNNLNREKDVYKWKKELEKVSKLKIDLINYNSNRNLWSKTELGYSPELACASLNDNNDIIIMPSANAANFDGTGIRQWYDVSGSGSVCVIKKLAFASNTREFTSDKNKRGVLVLE